MPVNVQTSAVSALKHFVSAYLTKSKSDNSTPDVVNKHLSLLRESNFAARRGAALALGVFPAEFIATNWRIVIQKLCDSCKIQVLSSFIHKSWVLSMYT